MLHPVPGRQRWLWPLLPVSTVLLFFTPFLLVWPG